MTDCGITPTPATVTVYVGEVRATEPDVIRCNVNKSRGELTRASFSFHYRGEGQTFDAGARVTVVILGQKAFTGIVKKVSAQPSFRCAGEMIVSVTAEDEMFKLRNNRFTRRQRQSPLAPVAFISSVYKRTQLAFDNPNDQEDIEKTGSTIYINTHTTNMAEWTMFVKGGEQNVIGSLHPVTKIADQFNTSRAGATGGGSFILHDHTSLDLSGPHAGGPAAAVFGVK